MFAELPVAACEPAGAFLAAYYESDHQSAYDDPQTPLKTCLLGHVATHALDVWTSSLSGHPLRAHALYQIGVVGHRLEGETWWWVAAELLDFALAQETDVFPEEMQNELARAFIACQTIYGRQIEQTPVRDGAPRSAERAQAALIASGLTSPLSAADQPLRILPHLEDEPLVRVRHWVTDAEPATLAAVSRAAHTAHYSFAVGKVVVDRDGSVSVEVAAPDSAATLGSLWDAANVARFLADSCTDALLTANSRH